jgi:hypothetical protein
MTWKTTTTQRSRSFACARTVKEVLSVLRPTPAASREGTRVLAGGVTLEDGIPLEARG